MSTRYDLNIRDRLYVSTNCFVERDLENILETASADAFLQIELSACCYRGHCVDTFLLKAQREKEFRFLIHNYFPPPAEPFILNLASNDVRVRTMSIRHCRRAIELCVQLGIQFYSVHAGFCYHTSPDMLGRQTHGFDTFPLADGKAAFAESLTELSELCLQHKVGLAVENNVLAKFALKDGRNELLLGVTVDDMLEIGENPKHNNVFFMIDLGHLKVSSHTLGFSAQEYIAALAPRTVAFHMSDNGGDRDDHQPVGPSAWFWSGLRSHARSDAVFVLELQAQKTNDLARQVDLAIAKLTPKLGDHDEN